jgi:very-short-patch-repair endonuclease
MTAKTAQWTEARYREYLKSGGKGSDLPAKAHIRGKGKERVVPAEWWALNGLSVPLYEFRFHETRKWRFDFFFPDVRLAIEIEGGIWQYGRHNRAKSYLKDLEKYNAAAEHGIRVLRYQPGKINCEQIKKTIAYTMAMGWTASPRTRSC